jgi:hypothetical protein
VRYPPFVPTQLALLMIALSFGCSGQPNPGPKDEDFDGFDADEDCDDRNRFTYPGAPEICDGKDNDCDGDVDEDVKEFPKWLIDEDGDGFGDELQKAESCEEPANAVDVGGDCDDANPAAYPDAPETCKDTEDLNCDGALPTDDNDKDGFIACQECDDFDASQNPKAPEVCNDEDDDCDEDIDEDPIDGTLWYPDGDGDGYGVPGKPSEPECDPPAGYGDGTEDCDDADVETYPGAKEQCDGLDNDCDEVVPTDELDEDGDGFDVCGDQDCDDDDASVGPDGDTDTDGTVDCYDEDDDDDGLLDADEIVGASGWVTDPRDPDTDDDGVDDKDDAAPLHWACATSVLYYDDFSTTPASDWDEAAGTWIWDGVDTYGINFASFGVTWLSDPHADLVVDVTMRLDNDIHDAGVIFRVADPGFGEYTGSYYYLLLDPGNDIISLDYWAVGLSNPLAVEDLDIDAGVWHEVTVRATGERLEAAIDGTWLLDVKDPTLTTGGVGLRTTFSQAVYDEILICL